MNIIMFYTLPNVPMDNKRTDSFLKRGSIIELQEEVIKHHYYEMFSPLEKPENETKKCCCFLRRVKN